MDDKLKAVLEKVGKLKALAARATTQAEAEAAAAQAAALIAKYQIDEATLETADPTRAESIGEDAPMWTGSRAPRWLGTLCSGLAKDHGCDVIQDGRGEQTLFRVAGRPSDVALVRYLFTWLMAEILRLSERERGLAAKTAFRLGAAVGVLRAMRAARSAETSAAPQGATTAMVLVDRAQASAAFLRKQFGGAARFASARASFSDRGAFERGKEAGGQLTPRHALPTGGRFLLGTGT